MNNKHDEETRDELLSLYFDGLLDKETEKEVDALIALDDEWAKEYLKIKELDASIKSLHEGDKSINLLPLLDLDKRGNKKIGLDFLKSLFEPSLSPAFVALLLVVIAGALYMISYGENSRNSGETPLVENTREIIPSPAVSTNVKARFVLYAPEAESVELVGGFNNWEMGSSPMRDPTGEGLWEALIVLPPGEHEYQFVINGNERIPDPLARIIKPDGFGGKNSVIFF